MKSLIVLLLFLTFTISARTPAARFVLLSVPQVSQAASRLGNAVAPRFRDTAAAVTVVLTMGAARYGMDLTRPSEILFYSFGEKPAMRIVAYALPDIKEPDDSGKLWGIRFRARRQGGLIAFDTEDLAEPLPTDPPGKNLKPGELLRGTIRAEAVHRHFQFGSFNTNNPVSRLIVNGLDELLGEINEANVIFSADENNLKVDLAVVPKEQSAVREWMRKPLPPKGKIEIFTGAQTLAVLRLNPTVVLKEYGQNYLLQEKKNLLPGSLPNAVTGFAVTAFRNSGINRSARLAVGIDPAGSASIQKEMEKLGYTPYQGWYQLRRVPPMFCSKTGDRAVFCGMEQLDRSTLENLFRPQVYQGTVPDRPFVCLDLEQPDRPLAELRFEDHAMRLVLQASDIWFAECSPLLEKPLLLPAGTRNR